MDTKDGEIILERFAEYHRGAPAIRHVVIRQYSTLRAAWTSLLRGELDLLNSVPPDAVEFLGSEQVVVTSIPRRYQFVVAFNSGKPPFTSSLLRRALNLAVDRQRLVANMLNGRGQPATGPLWPQHWAYDSSLATYHFDPAAAEALLDQAGFPRRTIAGPRGVRNMRLSFVCLAPADFRSIERLALEVQRQLFAIGIDMQFEALPTEEYGKRLSEGDFEAVLTELTSGPTFGRPYIFWRSARTSRGFNVFGYENPEVERLFDVLRSSTNEAAIRSAARRLQREFLDDPPALFLAWDERTRAVSRRFELPSDSNSLSSIWQWKPTSAPVLTASAR